MYIAFDEKTAKVARFDEIAVGEVFFDDGFFMKTKPLENALGYPKNALGLGVGNLVYYAPSTIVNLVDIKCTATLRR